ncbi:hypothetical protein [Bosea sp. 685]|uniref:hypothetical protein n=1 Tax=Bosea sp. 685 TaxID=3080057 RepID=UPI0028934533|nr:hypothetical protein [Bosea sp. 685]WNJ93539.1 hypothetical protein RMR04_15145 [Bosea sp. 685]
MTLFGSVEWLFEREAAAQEVVSLLGVVELSNLIEIKTRANAHNIGEAIKTALQLRHSTIPERSASAPPMAMSS